MSDAGIEVIPVLCKPDAAGYSVQFSTEKQLLSRNSERFRGGLVCKAHRLLYHSPLGSRVIKKDKAGGKEVGAETRSVSKHFCKVVVLKLRTSPPSLVCGSHSHQVEGFVTCCLFLGSKGS